MRALWGGIFALLFVTAGTAAGGVTLAGSPSHGHGTATSLTISHTNSGDYLAVAVFNHGTYPDNTTATYDGMPMDRINSAGPIGNTEELIWFGMVAPPSGTHDIVITDDSKSNLYYVIAQSFDGVHQTRPFLHGGGYYAPFFTAPYSYTVPSAAGWMVLDALWTDANHGGSIAPSGSGDNASIAFDSNGFGMGASYAAGAASVTMEWTWPTALSFVHSVVQLRPATDDAADVTLDNAGASAYAASTTTADATVTVGAGANRALTASLVFDNKSVSGVSVVYDPAGANQPLSLIKSEITSDTYGRAELWGLVAAATGTSKTVRVSWTGSSDIAFSAVSWTNVDQTGGTTSFARATSNTGNADPTILNVQITSALHNVSLDSSVAMEGITDTKWSEQTLLFGPVFLFHVGTGAASAYQRGSSAGYHRMAGNIGANAWAMVGCDIVAVVCTPPATPTITPGGPTTFCAGGSVTLTSSSPTGNQWYLDGNPIGGATAQQYDATASGSYMVTVTAGGCTSAPSAGTAVTVNPIPSTPVITAPSTVVPGSPNHPAAVPSNLGSTYAWSISNGTITSGQGSAQITFTAGSSGTLTLSVTETNAGCESAQGNATVTVEPGASALLFYTVTPCRQLDTRSGSPLASGGTLTVSLTGAPCGLPSGASAVSVNLTVTQQTGSGHLTIYPADQGQPLISNLNFNVGSTRANNAILGLSSDGTGRVNVFNGSGGTVHVILDVNGYFQ